MRTPGRVYRDEWLPNYYPSRAFGSSRLRVSRAGVFIVLSEDEDRQLEEVYMSADLHGRLERTGHIITKRNAMRALDATKKWFSCTYQGPVLHIISVTKRCNLACHYCHMSPKSITESAADYDLQLDTAEAIVDFILGTPNPHALIEFQGGEPFLNFAAIKHVVEYAKQANEAVGKDLDFTVVSNLMVAKTEDLRYCADNDISISYSLNGPPDIHDRYRVTASGVGSHARALRRITEIRAQFPGLISANPLCVVGRESPEEVVRMIDYFHDMGFDGVALIKLRHLGNARGRDLGYSFETFMRSYLAGLDHIMEKNRKGPRIYGERMVRVVLTKLLGEADVGFVDWRNPIGDVNSVLTYDYDGMILPSDEARSVRDAFCLGNVRDTTWDDLMQSKETFRTMNLSLRDREPECRECAYNPYCGVAPILEYARTGDATPRPHESEECLFVQALLDWTIKRFLDDPVPLMQMLPNSEAIFAKLLGNPPPAKRSRTAAGATSVEA